MSSHPTSRPGLSLARHLALLIVALIAALAWSLTGAVAEIEEQVLQCRKTCVEEQCVPEYHTCMTKTLGSPSSCRTIREDCEKSCVSTLCLP